MDAMLVDKVVESVLEIGPLDLDTSQSDVVGSGGYAVEETGVMTVDSVLAVEAAVPVD